MSRIIFIILVIAEIAFGARVAVLNVYKSQTDALNEAENVQKMIDKYHSNINLKVEKSGNIWFLELTPIPDKITKLTPFLASIAIDYPNMVFYNPSNKKIVWKEENPSNSLMVNILGYKIELIWIVSFIFLLVALIFLLFRFRKVKRLKENMHTMQYKLNSINAQLKK